jgi:hypothetical protein
VCGRGGGIKVSPDIFFLIEKRVSHGKGGQEEDKKSVVLLFEMALTYTKATAFAKCLKIISKK